MTKKERYAAALRFFQETMPAPQTELHYDSPFQLLVAVILSAQCTDKRVNMVTPELFRRFPSAHDMAKAEADDIFPYVSSISYPNNKAKALAGMARKLVSDFGGDVPADAILSVVFGQAAMAVDTHVFRVSERIGLTSGSTTPLDTELQLMRHIPSELVGIAHHWLILHGRYTCKARKPLCDVCGLTSVCRYYKQNS